LITAEGRVVARVSGGSAFIFMTIVDEVIEPAGLCQESIAIHFQRFIPRTHIDDVRALIFGAP
jgi:hypothetical protein